MEGLVYIPNFINQDTEQTLLARIDAAAWLQDLKRRVQHYGYKYDYKKRNVDYTMRLGELPTWAAELSELIHEQKHSPFLFDQLIINEYEPGQGISPHIDCEPCFENCIASLSLGAGCTMDFYPKDKPEVAERLYLEPRSLLILQGAARYDWLHGIRPLKNDKIGLEKRPRARRVSLTFRKVII